MEVAETVSQWVLVECSSEAVLEEDQALEVVLQAEVVLEALEEVASEEVVLEEVGN
jgi:hypothetical protein